MKTVNIGSMLPWALLLCFWVQVNYGKECPQSKILSTNKLVCYYSSLGEVDGCHCSHVILPANLDVKGIKQVKEKAKGVKIYVTVNEFNQGLIDFLNSTKIDGLELNLKKLDSKNDINDFISTVKSKIGTDLDIALSVPAKAELVAKYFNFKALSKHADLFILETAFLGASANVTFHPSRLSGMWDMQNTDSVVDLVSGLGAPLSKVVIAAPVQAFQFTLQNSEYSAPGSPALELQSITRNQLCMLMKENKNWTLERDEDQAGPYIFSKNQWIAFEDPKSIDIKAKYSRVRSLAGIALKDLSQDGDGCGSTILEAAYNGLSRQARAPRGAVLHSLEREITDDSSESPDSIRLSPFKISRIVDTEGKIHVTRQDTRTEFQCSRQGYFVHPRSCNRFYRCVKFDQTSQDYNVFEFDCPAGLAFDERVEVCVWPGSLPHGTPCSGSSEIAPVPRERFVCPSEPGYYPDPENCRWFFACLDHGKSPLSAYEFRCPYGLVFDGERLVCEWPWLVPRCASGLGVGLDAEYYYGGAASGKGYAARGPQSTGLILENYNGLGQLGTLKLGGVSGKFIKPIATVYSNVGSGSLGLGYQNSDGYIERGGLSYKAALAMHNAGLLKVNNGVGYQANGEQAKIYGASGQGTQYSGQSQGSVLVSSEKNSYSEGSTASLNQGFNYNQVSSNIQTGQYSANRAKTYDAFTSGQGYQSADNLHLVQDNVATAFGGETGQYTSGAYQSVGTVARGHDNYQGHNNLLTTGYGLTGSAISSQTFSQGGGAHITSFDRDSVEIGKQRGGYEYVGSGENTFENNVEVNYQSSIRDGNSGAVSSQTITQYHGDGRGNGASGATGSINIIGGGYSAVDSLSGAGVSNNGESHVFAGSPAIISTTSAPADNLVSVPTVVAVPVPGIKSRNGFDTLQGGVIANIPELQYKIKTHEIGAFKNVSNNIANFVVTPTIATQNEYLSTYGQNSVFGNKLNKFSVSTARPFVAVTKAHPQTYISSTVQPIVADVDRQTHSVFSSASFHKYDINEGYKYEKPAVEFEEKSQVVTVSTARPVIVKQQPQFIISSTPATPEVTTYSYAQQTGQDGYAYQKPANPTIISKFSIRKPVAQIKQKTAIEDYTYEQPQTYYQQPSVNLYQQPELLKTYSYNKQPVNTYNNKNVFLQAVGVHKEPQFTPVQTYGVSIYQYSNYGNNQQGGYVYDKPSINFEDNPVEYSTPKPAVVNTYFSTDNSKVKSQQSTSGYVYNKPQVNFEESPVVYSTPKSIIAPAQKTTQPDSGYIYNKPSVEFNESPVTYSAPNPTVVINTPKAAVVTNYFNQEKSHAKSESSGGYAYNKPAIRFHETPVTYSTSNPIQAVVSVTQPQTAVVSNYLNLQNTHAKSESNSYQANSDYVYNQPSVKFYEAPVISSTPKSVVGVQSVALVDQPQPAVVTNYFNLENSNTKSESSSYQHQSNGGYVYNKPSIKINENPLTYSTPKPVVALQPVVPLSQPHQAAVLTSYFNLENSHAKSESAQQAKNGYVYNKPSVGFYEAKVISASPRPGVTVQPVIAIEQPQPAVTTSYLNLENSLAKSKSSSQQANSGYVYNKPSVEFYDAPVISTTHKPMVTVQPVVAIEQPQSDVTTNYFNLESSHAKPESSSYQSNRGGYVFNRPSVELHEIPVTYSTPKPAVPLQQPQPGIATNYYNFEKSHAKSVSSSQQDVSGYVYNKPSVEFHENPVTYSTPKSIVPVEQPQPAIVTSYFNLENSQAKSESSSHQSSAGYIYNKPSIEFNETPVTYSTLKPIVTVEQQKPVFVTNYTNSQLDLGSSSGGHVYSQPTVQQVDTSAIPAVVNSYFNSQSKEENSGRQQINVGYSYPKPAVKFEERPLVYPTPQPSVDPAKASNYFNIDSIYDKQQNVRHEKTPVVYSTPKPAHPAIVTSYFNIGSLAPKPEVYLQNFENKDYSTPKPPVLSSNSYVGPSTSRPVVKENVGYTYPKPSISFVDEPQPVNEDLFVKKNAYVTGQYEQNIQENYDYTQNAQVVENYQFPEYQKLRQVVFGDKLYQQQGVKNQEPQIILNYVQSTPKPTYISTVKTIPRKKIAVTPATVTFYDSRYTSTPATYSTTYNTQVSSKFDFSSQDEQYQYKNILKATTAQPVRTYLPVTSTVKITSELPIVTKGKVVEEYIAPEITTLARDFLPVRIRTKAPSREYLPVEVTTPSLHYVPVIVSTQSPSREYLPVEVSTEPRRRIQITSATAAPEITTLDRGYLPVRARITSTVSPTVRPSVRPAVIKVSKPVTVIKQKDAHSLLSAKLGAQCTCVSNSLRLRKKQKIIIIEDGDEDDDGYIVDNGEDIVENYDAQRVVDIIPSNEVYLKSTTAEPVEIRKSVIPVRPVSRTYPPVTEVSEVFARKNISPEVIDDNSRSDKEITKAVRTGLKLVKQAAKEGAKEGTKAILSKSLDRYGPGGVRSRSETLQGSVDCQRAGLFRHPTECNKFYACRWDCTKKRFTLHVFNCPVHLTFDNSLGACNWPSQGPACVENTLITSD